MESLYTSLNHLYAILPCAVTTRRGLASGQGKQGGPPENLHHTKPGDDLLKTSVQRPFSLEASQKHCFLGQVGQVVKPHAVSQTRGQTRKFAYRRATPSIACTQVSINSDEYGGICFYVPWHSVSHKFHIVSPTQCTLVSPSLCFLGDFAVSCARTNTGRFPGWRWMRPLGGLACLGLSGLVWVCLGLSHFVCLFI